MLSAWPGAVMIRQATSPQADAGAIGSAMSDTAGLRSRFQHGRQLPQIPDALKSKPLPLNPNCLDANLPSRANVPFRSFPTMTRSAAGKPTLAIAALNIARIWVSDFDVLRGYDKVKIGPQTGPRQFQALKVRRAHW